MSSLSRSQWPRGLRRGLAAARFLGLRVRILSVEWMCHMYFVLFVRCLCEGLITCAEGSCRVGVSVSVIVKPRQWGGPGPVGGVGP